MHASVLSGSDSVGLRLIDFLINYIIPNVCICAELCL